MRHKSLPTFPAFDAHAPAVEPIDSRVRALRRRYEDRAVAARRLLDRATAGTSEDAIAAVRRLVVVTHQLAALERCASRCAASESVLSSTLSRLLAMAADPELAPTLRIAAARGAEPCAEDLALLYEDHDRPAHAGYARRAIALAQRAAAGAMS